MNAGVLLLDPVAVSGVKKALVCFRSHRAPDGDSEVYKTDDKCPYGEIQDAESPSAEVTLVTTEPGPSSRVAGIVLYEGYSRCMYRMIGRVAAAHARRGYGAWFCRTSMVCASIRGSGKLQMRCDRFDVIGRHSAKMHRQRVALELIWGVGSEEIQNDTERQSRLSFISQRCSRDDSARPYVRGQISQPCGLPSLGATFQRDLAWLRHTV
jgi:hypothetical protein